MQDNRLNNPNSFLDGIKDNAGLVLASGVLILIMGLLVLASPAIFGTSIVFIVGAALLVGGIGNLVFAVKSKARLLAYLLGGLTSITGIFMLSQPAAALGVLTIFLTIYLILSGILEIVLAFSIRPVESWGMTLFSGVVTVLLGVMLWSQFPFSGAWAIGLLLGTKLLFAGLSLTMLGLAARKRVNQIEPN